MFQNSEGRGGHQSREMRSVLKSSGLTVYAHTHMRLCNWCITFLGIERERGLELGRGKGGGDVRRVGEDLSKNERQDSSIYYSEGNSVDLSKNERQGQLSI
jgi:hypothetical protein